MVLLKFSLQIFVLLHFVDGFTYQSLVRDIEICGTTNGHRKYLELGDSGEIFAANISVPKVIKFCYIYVKKIKIISIFKVTNWIKIIEFYFLLRFI